MEEIKVFENEELNIGVRTRMNDDGSISINAEDTAIGFGWTQEKSGKTYVRWETLNGYCVECGFSQLVGKDDYIPESLFYRLGMKANNAVAERFQNWLAIDVIPSIRKHGLYAVDDLLNDPDLAIKAFTALKEEREKRIAAEQTIVEQRPLVDFANHVSQAKDTIGMDEMAKIANDENIIIGRNRLIKWLKSKKVLQNNRMPYQDYINRGYFDVVEVTKDTAYGKRVFPKTVITGKGQIWIIEKLRNEYGVMQMGKSQSLENMGTGYVIVHGYDNLYCVNRNGTVVAPGYSDKSGKLRKTKILSQTTRGKGYKCVGLMLNGKQVHVSVHRLVAEAFIPNPDNKPQVNHIDGNKSNNHADNLEWVTCSENVMHAFKNNLRKPVCRKGENNIWSKLNNDEVYYIKNSCENVKSLAKKFNVTISTIYKIKENKRWKHI